VTVFNVLVFGAMVVGLAFAAWAGGQRLATGEGLPFAIVPNGRGAAGLAALALAAFSLMRAAGKAGDLDCLDGLLATVPVPDVVGGVLLAEAGRTALFLGPPLAIVGGTFAVAVGAPSMAVTLPLTVAALTLFVVPIGFASGLVVRYVLTRYDPVANHRTLIVVVSLVAWMAFTLSGQFIDVSMALFDPLRATPLGWLADLLLLGVPHVDADPVRAAGAVGVAVAVAGVGVLATVRLSEAVWLADPPTATETETQAADADDGGLFGDTRFSDDVARIGDRFPRQSRAVATTVWLRARRAPIQLSYVLYPVFFGAGVFQDVFRQGYVPSYVPSTVLIYAAWGVGAAVTLNPIGAQGPTLPATLTSRIDGRAYLRGHLLVAAVVGGPVATLLTVGSALASPLAAREVALLAVATPVFSVAAAALACGFGVLFPRFGSVRVTSNREAVVPSKTAAATYSLVLLVLFGLAGVGVDTRARELVVDGLGVPSVAVVVGAVAPLLVGSYLSYRFAAGRIADYRLD